jgi:hypothetical protein
MNIYLFICSITYQDATRCEKVSAGIKIHGKKWPRSVLRYNSKIRLEIARRIICDFG